MIERLFLDLNDGRLAADNAIDERLISSSDASAIIAHNAVVSAAIRDVEAYEAAQRLRAGEQPPRDDPDTGGWSDAGKFLQDAPDAIKALARIRSGMAYEGEGSEYNRAADTLLITTEYGQIPVIDEPTPEDIERINMPSITPRQLRLMALNIGITDMTVEMKIAELFPDQMDQQAALVEWRYATSYARMHPLVEQLRNAMQLEPVEFDALWNYGRML